jgi:hypothetical protein
MFILSNMFILINWLHRTFCVLYCVIINIIPRQNLSFDNWSCSDGKVAMSRPQRVPECN